MTMNQMTPPGLPSPQEVSDMARLRSLVSNGETGMVRGGHAGSQPMAQASMMPVMPPPVMPNMTAMAAYDPDLQEAMRTNPEAFGLSSPPGGYGGGYGGVAPPAYSSYAGVVTEAETNFMAKLKNAVLEAEGDEAQMAPTQRVIQGEAVPVTRRAAPEAPRAPAKWRIAEAAEKTFDLVHPSGDALVKGLALKETATFLLTLMNRGFSFNHASVLRVMQLDDEFKTKRKDALQYKAQVRRLVQEGDKPAAKIMDNTYTRVRDEALALKAKLVKLAEAV